MIAWSELGLDSAPDNDIACIKNRKEKPRRIMESGLSYGDLAIAAESTRYAMESSWEGPAPMMG
jgi:hypothetical protein